MKSGNNEYDHFSIEKSARWRAGWYEVSWVCTFGVVLRVLAACSGATCIQCSQSLSTDQLALSTSCLPHTASSPSAFTS